MFTIYFDLKHKVCILNPVSLQTKSKLFIIKPQPQQMYFRQQKSGHRLLINAIFPIWFPLLNYNPVRH